MLSCFVAMATKIEIFGYKVHCTNRVLQRRRCGCRLSRHLGWRERIWQWRLPLTNLRYHGNQKLSSVALVGQTHLVFLTNCLKRRQSTSVVFSGLVCCVVFGRLSFLASFRFLSVYRLCKCALAIKLTIFSEIVNIEFLTASYFQRHDVAYFNVNWLTYLMHYH